MAKTRDRNYEIMRIIAMLMIVCMHYLSKGGALVTPTSELGGTSLAAWFIESFLIVAVNAYVLVSGYFGIDADRITNPLQTTLRLYVQVWFYSMVIGAVSVLTGLTPFDKYDFLAYILPFSTEHYWFATAFLLLTVFMPFLNEGIKRLEKKQLQRIMMILCLVLSVVKTILPIDYPWDNKGYDAVWLIFMYMTGAYIKKYGLKLISSRARAIIVYILSAFIIFASFFILHSLYEATGRFGAIINAWYSYNSLFCYVASIGFFMAFNPKFNKGGPRNCPIFLRKISGATFGVYLIHEHMEIRYQWPVWARCEAFIDAGVPVFLLHMLITVVVVYVVCTGLELIRQEIFALIRRRF